MDLDPRAALELAAVLGRFAIEVLVAGQRSAKGEPDRPGGRWTVGGSVRYSYCMVVYVLGLIDGIDTPPDYRPGWWLGSTPGRSTGGG